MCLLHLHMEDPGWPGVVVVVVVVLVVVVVGQLNLDSLDLRGCLV